MFMSNLIAFIKGLESRKVDVLFRKGLKITVIYITFHVKLLAFIILKQKYD